MNEIPVRVLVIGEEPAELRPVHDLLPNLVPRPFEVEQAAALPLGLRRLKEGDIDVALLHHDRQTGQPFRWFHEACAFVPGVPVKALTVRNGASLSIQAIQEGKRHLLTRAEVPGRVLRRSLRLAIERTRRRKAERAVRLVREEVSFARTLQQKLFPTAPLVEGLELGGASWPAEATGGDYFDFLALPGGRLGVAIGDVSGHGFGPALVMASTRAYLRALAQEYAAVGPTLARANDLLFGDTLGDVYVTLLLAEIDPQSRRLRYASAGHHAGYILDPTGRVRTRLESTSLPLGIYPDAEFAAGPVLSLDPGDTLLLLTDGITEARDPDGAPFGHARALDIARVYRHLSPAGIVENLYHAVRAFAHNRPQVDDITSVIARVPPG